MNEYLSVELRWVRPSGASTKPSRLQWREVMSDSEGGEWLNRDWTDVPVVVLPPDKRDSEDKR